MTWIYAHGGPVIVEWRDRVVIDGCVNFWGSLTRFLLGSVGTVDYWGVDGGVRGLGNTTLWAGRALRRIQSGVLQQYVYASLYFSGGVILILLLVLYFWGGSS